jgi:hypothetical protein
MMFYHDKTARGFGRGVGDFLFLVVSATSPFGESFLFGEGLDWRIQESSDDK